MTGGTMKVGIIGLPFSGKTALFEAITGPHGVATDHSGAAHVATVPVPDERLEFLTRIGSPRKVTPTHISFVDAAGVGSDADAHRAAVRLGPVRDADGLVHVVRFFEWPSAPPHPRGSLDAARDAREVEAELILADLEVVERRVQKLSKQAQKHTPHQDRDRKELALLERLRDALSEGRRAGSLDMTEEEAEILRTFQLLSEKPILTVLNVHEDETNSDTVREAAALLGSEVVVISAKIEKEIAELAPDERGEFIEALGVGEPAATRVIRACYEKIGLRSFFTGVAPNDELRAWTIRAGATALEAAGKVHSDMARGFIRAEVVNYAEVKALGSMKAAREQNKIRLEGKEYVVQDGDIIHFRFKV